MPVGYAAVAAISASQLVDFGVFYKVSAGGGAVNLTLPPVSAEKPPIGLINMSGTNAATFKTADSSLINGTAGATGIGTSTQYGVLWVQCDGSNWQVIAKI